MTQLLSRDEDALVGWNANGLPPLWTTVADVLIQRAATEPDRMAFSFVDANEFEDILTYGSVARAAKAVAVALGQDVVGKRVLLSLTPGRGYLTAFYGCLLAGAIAVPCCPPSPRRRTAALHAIALDSQASVLITDQLVKDVVLTNLDVAHIPGGLRTLLIEDIDDSMAAFYREVYPKPHIALLQYTSGSTGAPKGVLVGNDNLLANAYSIAAQTGWNRDTVLAGWCPPYHDLGLIGGVLGPVIVGFPSYHISPIEFLYRPRRWLELITRYHATIGGGPNFCYDLCVDRVPPECREGLDLSTWTLALSGAEMPQARTIERFSAAFEPYGFRREAFQPSYGMAEATLLITGGGPRTRPVYRTVDRERLDIGTAVDVPDGTPGSRTIVGCGAAAAHHLALIVDPETRQPVADGQVGEVWFKGPSVTHGYWHNPAATEATFRTFLANGDGFFLRTGDLGVMQQGELFIIGRMKDLVIIRGRNHAPDDIEQTVRRSHPALRADGVAFAVELDGAERLAVAHEVNPDHPQFDVGQITRAIRSAVAAEHDIQADVVALLPPKTVPKTTSGKPQRSACRARLLTGTLATLGVWKYSAEATTVADTPVTAAIPSVQRIEDWLCERLSRAVGADPDDIDVDRPFAESGLDSVGGVRIVADLSVLLGRPLPATLVWEHSTVTQLARYLAQGAAA
jgi:acyl-CoA synthetase (AMP-forming)/AMP-acid ligase II/acyl carrier protein